MVLKTPFRSFQTISQSPISKLSSMDVCCLIFKRERERERAGRKRKKKRRNVFTENARKRGRERYKRLGIKKDSERESYANR